MIEIDTLDIIPESADSIVSNYTQAVGDYIQSSIKIYNTTNGVAFSGIDAMQKYTIDPNYTHYQFAVDVLAWNIQVWEYARQVFADVQAGTRTLPTQDELIAELPIYTGAV